MRQEKTYRTFQFENVVAWESEFRGTLSASEHPNVEVGNPPVFKGTPDVWCPEDMLIGALDACLMLTFLYQMQRRKLEVLAYESSAQGGSGRPLWQVRSVIDRLHTRCETLNRTEDLRVYILGEHTPVS